MTALLDANVLIALVVTEHVHHDAAAEWLSTFDPGFATCPITQEAWFGSWCARANPQQLRVMWSAQSRMRTATSFGPTASLSPMSRSAAWSVTDK